MKSDERALVELDIDIGIYIDAPRASGEGGTSFGILCMHVHVLFMYVFYVNRLDSHGGNTKPTPCPKCIPPNDYYTTYTHIYGQANGDKHREQLRHAAASINTNAHKTHTSSRGTQHGTPFVPTRPLP